MSHDRFRGRGKEAKLRPQVFINTLLNHIYLPGGHKFIPWERYVIKTYIALDR